MGNILYVSMEKSPDPAIVSIQIEPLFIIF